MGLVPKRLIRLVASFSSLFVVLAVLLVLPASAQALSEPYRKLKKQVEGNSTVDTALIDSLPEPTGPTEFFLRSRTRRRLQEALRDLDRALEESSSPNERIVEAWLELSLLDEPSHQRLKHLGIHLNRHRGQFEGGTWVLAAKYAAHLEDYERAYEWGRRALKRDGNRREAMLDLAAYALELGKHERSRQYLDRYLLQFPEGDRSRHWNLRGRLLRTLGSDSEAYLAYSHVVRNYPNSLELDEAERQLSTLSLPGPFRPGRNHSRVRSADRASREEREAQNQGERADHEEQWKVQLGSFRERKRARAFKRRMEDRLDTSLVISRAWVNGARYYRVQIAPFKSKYEARQQKDKLAQIGIDAFILDG